MNRNKRIICKNSNGISIEFNYESDCPFFLESVDGIYSIKNNIIASENTMTNGSTYQGSTVTLRNIVLTAVITENHVQARNLLYRCFESEEEGLFIYQEDDEEREINYIVESINIEEKGVIRHAFIYLQCHNPFFRDRMDTTISMARWQPLFEFDHEFIEQGEEIDTKVVEKLKSIDNLSSADNIGLTITFEAEGYVKNPGISHVETNRFIQIGTERKPFIMNSGDKVVITTHTNQKNVYKIVNSQKININEYLEEDSEYIQLKKGANNLRYSATSGEEFLNVDVTFRYHYSGV